MMSKQYTKKKLDVQLNEEGAAPCKHCMKVKKRAVYPRIVDVDDLYYAQCPECKYYDIYEFLGLSHKKAIQIWNNTMLFTGLGTSNYDKD